MSLSVASKHVECVGLHFRIVLFFLFGLLELGKRGLQLCQKCCVGSHLCQEGLSERVNGDVGPGPLGFKLIVFFGYRG